MDSARQRSSFDGELSGAAGQGKGKHMVLPPSSVDRESAPNFSLDFESGGYNQEAVRDLFLFNTCVVGACCPVPLGILSLCPDSCHYKGQETHCKLA